LKSFEDEYESDMKVFNPVYLERIKPFHTLKFVDPFRINNSRFRTWEDRTPKDYFNQNEGPHDCGLAYEWAIELCNLSKNHLWFNVPHAADNDALRKMAELVYERLDPNLMVYLEYSNETWNWSWQLRDQYEWVRANGGWVTGHVNSSKNVFTIWQDVFGDQSHRIKRVMATWPYKTRRLEECTTEDYDIVSGTYYWNASGERRDTWDANTTVDQMLQDIQANIRGDWYEKKKEYADKVHAFGKELYCYAGGLGGDQRDTLDGTSSGYPYWRNFQKLQKDPRLLPIIHEVVDSLTSLGYSGGIEHSLIGNWDYNPCCKRISFWGLMNSLYGDAENYPKYMGMIDKLQDCEQHVHSADRNVSLSKEKSILPMAQSKRVPGGIQYRVPQKDNWELSVFTADGRRIANICSYGNKSSTVTTTLHPGLNIIRFRINGKIVDVQKVTLHWAQ